MIVVNSSSNESKPGSISVDVNPKDILVNPAPHHIYRRFPCRYYVVDVASRAHFPTEDNFDNLLGNITDHLGYVDMEELFSQATVDTAAPYMYGGVKPHTTDVRTFSRFLCNGESYSESTFNWGIWEVISNLDPAKIDVSDPDSFYPEAVGDWRSVTKHRFVLFPTFNLVLEIFCYEGMRPAAIDELFSDGELEEYDESSLREYCESIFEGNVEIYSFDLGVAAMLRRMGMLSEVAELAKHTINVARKTNKVKYKLSPSSQVTGTAVAANNNF